MKLIIEITENPGETVELEITPERMLGLFTDVASVKTEIKGLKKQIDLVWKAGFILLTGCFGTLGALITLM